MDKEAFRSYLERGKSVLSAKAKEEQELNDRAKNSFLPYPLFWLTNLGVASGMPPYTSLIILLQIIVLFVPEYVWVVIGIEGREHVLHHPEFVQYFVLNSTYPNGMYIFWVLSPFALIVSLVLWLKHIHIEGYGAYLVRRKMLLAEKRSFSLLIQLTLFVALYFWMVFSNLGPPSFLRGVCATKKQSVPDGFLWYSDLVYFACGNYVNQCGTESRV